MISNCPLLNVESSSSPASVELSSSADDSFEEITLQSPLLFSEKTQGSSLGINIQVEGHFISWWLCANMSEPLGYSAVYSEDVQLQRQCQHSQLKPANKHNTTCMYAYVREELMY